MAEFPSYARVLVDGFGESFDPSVERTEMERGMPKERLLNSGVLMELPCTLLFFSAADAAAFETWYFDTIRRIGNFNFLHPRTGAVVLARFKGGNIGTLAPVSPGFGQLVRQVTIEYLRP